VKFGEFIPPITGAAMFSRKKDSPKTSSRSSFQLDILTTEYLIQGTAAGDQQFYLPTSSKNWSPIELKDVSLTAVDRQDVPVRKVDRFEVQGEAVVAMIPHKDAMEMDQYDSYLVYDKGLKGIFYIGPYIFEGTLMIMDSNYDDFAASLLMNDVTIRHMSTKSKMEEITASDVLVNTRWMHGRELG